MDSREKKIESTPLFAADPFVASFEGNQANFGECRAKTIEEILDAINGYAASDDSNELLTVKPIILKNPTMDSREPIMSTHTPPLRSSIPVDVRSDSTLPSSGEHHLDCDWDPVVEDHEMPGFDSRLFSESQEAPQGNPAPIQRGFECDRDYFDYVTIQTRLQEATVFQTGIPAVVAVRSDSGNAQPADASNAVATVASAAAEGGRQDSTAGVFLAGPDDVIFIDGKDGYGYIDLACFSISKTSFESNQIRVQLDEDGANFQVDYRNVTHALFADGVEIELAANEIGFVPRR